ncbi:uncharacterized protein YdhG (YjbR/CyaY superfamily) [Labedella gwakjiensis]|uniref:DUF1801 domain-containing protein n=1 Tax=Labedella gwakjiensis TaxID=390269 RepID=A0A2P8GUC4_9MICO|nr:DUF1801 domain-containing protein [Labedella gwakjiensis]PSL37572.1 uncharacterized protein YdhG (YjbR/CyaY superfamily) [Labedella gwakjiensis]RUQ84872.1 DUF1801 domain-containing protein [Labedella gwakjiensis]
MANEVSEYIAELPEPERSRIREIYDRARALVPDAVEGVSYGMPSLIYRGKGLVSVMNTKKHIGVYPYGNLADLADDVAAAGLGSTKGSIHLRAGERLPDDLLERFVRRRVAQIDGA